MGVCVLLLQLLERERVLNYVNKFTRYQQRPRGMLVLFHFLGYYFFSLNRIENLNADFL